MASLARADGVRYVALVPNVRGADLAVAAGVDALTVTVSVSRPYNEKHVKMTVDESVEAVRGIAAVGLHLHETRGTALVNAYAAMEQGVSRFDTSIGGLAGSPRSRLA